MKKSKFDKFIDWVIKKCDVVIEANAIAVAEAEQKKATQIEQDEAIENDDSSLTTAVAIIDTIYSMK
ncbi:MAG: hypothetical protein FWE90_00795 [Defluviitaleaceae bacterium]|nr:hypothetical protein [Defluviitaleaceae bacterium]